METIYKGIEPGTEIVDCNGHKVGSVHEVICNEAQQLQMVTVQRGLIFKTDVAVPAVAIAKVADGKVYLTVEKDTLAPMIKPEAPAQAGAERPVPLEADQQLVADGTVEQLPNAAGVRPAVMHDMGTGDRTHDMATSTAGMPGGPGTNINVSAGPYGSPDPSLSQEPTSTDRT